MRLNEIIDISKLDTSKRIQECVFKKQNYIIDVKKSAIKRADDISCFFYPNVENNYEIKENKPIENPDNRLDVKVVINTTNIFDSHEDVHINGIWTKSLKEYKFIEHIREHKSGFENIISDGDDLKAYVKDFDFKELGFDYNGKTQALIFESIVDKDRNPFMHNQYAKGWVKQHSVGMRYINVFPAIDNKNYVKEYKAWKKYYDRIGNKEDIKQGFFFAVTEGKALEGSAVTKGSNHVTPTINNNNSEPGKTSHSGNHKEPSSNDTQKKKYFYLH